MKSPRANSLRQKPGERREFVPAGLRAGFTLVEMLVAFAVLALLLAILSQAITRGSALLGTTAGKAEQFREARAAMESIVQTLSRASLNTYWDYNWNNVGAATVPGGYARHSELRFLSGRAPDVLASAVPNTHAMFFQAPTGYTNPGSTGAGMENLLNTCGFYIERNSDALFRPAGLNGAVPARRRYRLMELREPANALTLYQYTGDALDAKTYADREWYQTPVANRNLVRPLAENIIALILRPQFPEADQKAQGFSPHSLAPTYLYDSASDGEKAVNAYLDSRNQLPPVMQVTLVAIDETSANRLGNDTTAIETALTGLFADAALHESDLEILKDRLETAKINYQVFSTMVNLPASKWTIQQ